MASTYCWPSVSIKRGASLVVARKVVKAEYGWTFGYLLVVIDNSFSNEQVARVITSKNDQFIDPVHEVPLDSPVELCQQYGLKVCYYLMPQQTENYTVADVYFNFYFAYLLTLCLPIFFPRNITSS